MKVEFIGTKPEKAHDSDGAFDLRAAETTVVMYDAVTKVKTGTRVNIPKGYVGLMFSRSGHGAKFGVTLANSVGVIDAGYQGEIIVAMTKNTKGLCVYNEGDRIAQLMILPIPHVEMVETTKFDQSLRGENGFGSTGEQ